MDIEAYINPYNDINTDKIYLQKPTDCPYCGKGIEPIELTSHYVSQIDEVVEILFCNKCQKVFVAKYNDASKFEGIPLNYNEVLPKTNDIEQIDKIVQEKFPTFCEIYKQAVRADKLELNLIVGPGYRKALEFLLKDYCISFNEDEKEKIIGTSQVCTFNNYPIHMIEGNELNFKITTISDLTIAEAVAGEEIKKCLQLKKFLQKWRL